MNLGDECQKLLIFIALIIAGDEGWEGCETSFVPTKFIIGDEGGRW